MTPEPITATSRVQRHPTDFVRLAFGLAFLATGAGFIVHEATDRTIDPGWIAAIALVTIGCAFLVATLMHQPRRAAGSDLPFDRRPNEPQANEPQADEPQAEDATSLDPAPGDDPTPGSV